MAILSRRHEVELIVTSNKLWMVNTDRYAPQASKMGHDRWVNIKCHLYYNQQVLLCHAMHGYEVAWNQGWQTWQHDSILLEIPTYMLRNDGISFQTEELN